MNDPSIRNPAYQSLTDQQFFEIDELCDRFDQELVDGPGPRIETFLAEAPEAARDGVLAELLAIEIERRLSCGEQVSADDYRSRFPDHGELIKNAFDFARNSDASTGPIGRFDEPTLTVAAADTAVSRIGTTSESQRAEDATSFAPQPFGRYTLQRLLGKGGMGSVYLAHDGELERKVAIKFPEFDDRPDTAAAGIERFRREARAMATVHHPNICPVFDVGQHDGRHYLTMAYIDGRTLSEVVGSLSQAEAVRLVMTTARALHAAHQAGLVHRDLKPSNVMLDKQGEPIVMDFGLASRAAVSESGLTHSGLIIGSPAYMAPEQVDAAHDRVGPRTDVYALGVILYQLLTGCRPFEGAGLSVLGKIAAGVRPESPSQIAAVSPSLEAICLKAMAHRIEDRFQTAEVLADSLDDWLKTPDAAPVEARASRRKTALIAGGILMLAVGSLLMAIVTRPDAVSQTGSSSSVTVSNDDRLESIPSSDVVLDDAEPTLLKAPFDEHQARAGQQEWADHLGLPVEYTNSIGMKFRLIPPGEFLMGSTPEEIEAALKVADSTWLEHVQSEDPQHKVVLTKPIYVGVTEVTQAQYEQVTGTNPSHFSATGERKDLVANLETGDHPVETVSWYDAADFCAKLSQLEHSKPFYQRTGEEVTLLDGTGYRLPTEAEWEYACRAGTTTRFWNGDQDQDLISSGWSDSNAGSRTHAAGESRSNPFGLSDMHGNVWEWVQDGWDPAFYSQFQEIAAHDPSSPFLAGQYPRLVRGGDWHSAPFECRSAQRLRTWPNWQRDNIGFRVVLVADAVKELLGRTSANAPPPAVAPFNEKQAKVHQEAWAEFLGEPVETTNSIGMKLVVIPPGQFKMGEPGQAVDVTLTRPFRFGVHEITQRQWKAVMGSEPWKGQENVIEGEKVAANYISWEAAIDFCRRLTEREREADRVRHGWEYRLPTEAEWEYACRAGTVTAFSFGNDASELIDYAWHNPNAEEAGEAYPHAVGLKKPNQWGLHDNHGNVREWCSDWYGDVLSGGTDPTGPTVGNWRAFRGGCWNINYGRCRSAFRLWRDQSSPESDTGLRVVLGPAPDEAPPPAIAPFDTQQAKAHQEAWARHLGEPVVMTNSVGRKFSVIPPGKFKMGDLEFAVDVTLTNPFRFGIHEVTQGQW